MMSYDENNKDGIDYSLVQAVGVTAIFCTLFSIAAAIICALEGCIR